jgi:protein transport protein SEC23
MNFYDAENIDGVRLNWNHLPNSKSSALKNVIPPCVLYSPNKDLENLMTLEYEPLKCRCASIINPHCTIDYKSKTWFCVFCNTRNPFPTHYATHISPENLPAELISEYTTIEYVSQKTEPTPLVFLFMIDLCMDQTELIAVRDAI